MKRKCFSVLLLLALPALSAGCAHAAASTPTNSSPWREEDVTLAFGPDALYGVLTLPPGEGPHPAIVIVSGSVNPSTGARSGVSSRYHIDHAREMVLHGFAVLRYDPPGVGRSTGQRGVESLDSRTAEAMAALRSLQARPDIQPNRIGLWADSQGVWVIGKAAAGFPEDVAFLIGVSGSAVSVAEQQVYSIEAQSAAAGFAEEDIAKAGLFGRLLIDWQLTHPIYRQANEAAAQKLGGGPWDDFMALVYEPGDITPAESLLQGIEILKSIQDEPWTRFLYLRQLYIPQLESIPPEQAAALRGVMEPSLLEDPKAYWTRVRCPVLAFFGEDDLLQPTAKSAALYEQYLTEAGNQDFEIVVIPGVGHSIQLSMPTYGQTLADWLDQLYGE